MRDGTREPVARGGQSGGKANEDIVAGRREAGAEAYERSCRRLGGAPVIASRRREQSAQCWPCGRPEEIAVLLIQRAQERAKAAGGGMVGGRKRGAIEGFRRREVRERQE